VYPDRRTVILLVALEEARARRQRIALASTGCWRSGGTIGLITAPKLQITDECGIP
jgi:hypothetical protein